MHYITHENHFKFGWGNEVYNFDKKFENYWVEFGRAKYMPKSFREECINAAKLIGENTTQPIMVCFSGGIDSEIIVRSFQEAGIPIEVAIMQLNYNGINNVNHHDNKYAFDYVMTHSIPYHVVEIDLGEFIKNSFQKEADEFKGDYLGVLIHTEIVKKFPNHHCVLGGGDIKLKRHRFNGRPNVEGLYIEESEISISAIEAAYRQNHGVSNRFFMHTPELMLAWLTDPDVNHWIKYEYALVSKFTTVDFHGIKAFVLYRHWPDMKVRPKFNGFEKVTLWDETKRNEHDPQLLEIIRNVKEKYRNGYKSDIVIDYDNLMKMLLPI